MIAKTELCFILFRTVYGFGRGFFQDTSCTMADGTTAKGWLFVSSSLAGKALTEVAGIGPAGETALHSVGIDTAEKLMVRSLYT